jgi:hypothetical protein
MKKLIKLVATLVAGTTLSVGCVSVEEMEKKVEKDVETEAYAPKALPKRNITNFSDGLRCMDNMFINYGIGDIVVLLEDLEDRTKGVKAGTRDMMISAISDMTKRSSAIQVIAFGKDSGNLVSFLEMAGQKGAYQNIPPFDIRGSISQLDKDIVRRQKDVGIKADTKTGSTPIGGGYGKSASASATIMGLDLSIVTTHNMAVLPGITSRNSILISKSGEATDAGAAIDKLGIEYTVALTKSEGMAQALRALIELSAMELFGKLLKVPYWNCLGVDPTHEDIKNEIADWFYAMSNGGTLTQYLKTQLIIRGYYRGQINNTPDPVYQKAIVEYKGRLGMPKDPGVDLDFFTAFLNTSPSSVPPSRLAYLKKAKEGKVAPATQVVEDEDGEVTVAKAPSKPAKKKASDNLAINVSSNKGGAAFSRGEEVQISVKSQSNGYLYCFFQDADKNIVRFFPNRYRTDGFVAKDGEVKIPGDMPFSINANENGASESVYCYLAARKVFTELPHTLRKADFEPVALKSQDALTGAFSKVLRGRVGVGSYTIRVQ